LTAQAADVIATLPNVHIPDRSYVTDDTDIHLDVGWGDPDHYGHSNLADYYVDVADPRIK
jgi:hypothetical protein